MADSLEYFNLRRPSSKFAMDSKMSFKTVSSSGSGSGSTGMKGPSSMEKMAKVPKYQNTYRLDSKKPFKAHEVYKILESVVLREAAHCHVYDHVVGMKMAQTIAGEVRSLIRNLNYDRYKICVLVYLGEKKLQGYQAAFRALWDSERDAWTTYFYECRTYFISCTCYGLYHD